MSNTDILAVETDAGFLYVSLPFCGRIFGPPYKIIFYTK